VLAIVDILEHDDTFVNLNPKAEPQLGKRGIYRALADRGSDSDNEMAMLWVLNQSDGKHSLLDIAERSKLKFGQVRAAAALLEECGLLRREA